MTALYILGLFFLVMVIKTFFWFMKVAVLQYKLMKYVKINRPESWRDITRVFGVSGGRNSFKGLAYIDGSRDNDDANILMMKMKFKQSLRWMVGSFIAAFAMAFLITWLVFKLYG